MYISRIFSVILSVFQIFHNLAQGKQSLLLPPYVLSFLHIIKMCLLLNFITVSTWLERIALMYLLDFVPLRSREPINRFVMFFRKRTFKEKYQLEITLNQGNNLNAYQARITNTTIPLPTKPIVVNTIFSL